MMNVIDTPQVFNCVLTICKSDVLDLILSSWSANSFRVGEFSAIAFIRAIFSACCFICKSLSSFILALKVPRCIPTSRSV